MRRNAPGGGKLAPHADFERRRIAEAEGPTLDELCLELAVRGVSVHRYKVARPLRRLWYRWGIRRNHPISADIAG